MKKINLDGQTFGKLTVMAEAPPDKKEAKWVCRCECGGSAVFAGSRLRNGRATHCGCSKTMFKNGQSLRPEYSCWKAMIYRCTNPDKSHYFLYGGRGIKVCEQWLNDFWQFLKDIGERPGPDYSLDRIDTNGNYEPGNVRWATIEVQNANKRPPVKRTNFYEYQRKASSTSVYPNKGEFMGIVYCSLGAAGEIGEVLNKVKKVYRDGGGEFTAEARKAISDEIGDSLWYLSQLCQELGLDFSKVATNNLDKLAARAAKGTLKGSGDNR